VCSFWLDGLLGFIFVGLIVVNILGYIKLGLSILLEYCFFVSLFFGMKIFFINIYIYIYIYKIFYLVGVFFLSLCVLECKILFIQKKKKKKKVKEMVF
jgi:hypothetical protein